MVFVVPRIETAKYQDDQGIYEIRKSDTPRNDEHVNPTIHRAERVFEAFNNLIELIAPQRKSEGERGRD